MRLFIFVIAFLLVFLAVVVLVVLNYLRRGVKKITKVVTGDYDDDEAFRRMADKHYRGKKGDPQFDKDYFKSKTGSTTSDGKQQRPGKQSAQQDTRRAASQPGGITIIDERAGQRKIFAEDEGEYVEFTEE